MNTYNLNDSEFLKSKTYKSFTESNKGLGNLSLRAYTASGALPIEGLRVVISTYYDDNIIIIYEGNTNESGIIENILLPAPIYDENNLISPLKIVYNIQATYKPFSFYKKYLVNVFDGITVQQNIIVENMNMGGL